MPGRGGRGRGARGRGEGRGSVAAQPLPLPQPDEPEPEPEPEPMEPAMELPSPSQLEPAPEPALQLTRWPGGVHRTWVEKSDAGSPREAAVKPPCRFGAACTRPDCWYAHPADHPLSMADAAGSGTEERRFTVLTWNFQASQTRGPDVDAADRSGAEACLQQILTDPRLRCPRCKDKPADILSLQELQRCRRQVTQGDCYHCSRGTCRYDHAGWVAGELARHGYDGAMHEHGMSNTVGLFWRRDVFELPPRREGKIAADDKGTVFFCDFDRPETVGGSKVGAKATKKGAVLALLDHRATGQPLLVVGAHPSVPLGFDGKLAPEVPLAEMQQMKKKIDTVYRWNTAAKGDFPWLVAGDLNSVPHMTEGCAAPLVYKYMTACGLHSTYRTVLGSEPPLTSVKPEFRQPIDYIFTSKGLAAKGVLNVTVGGSPEDVAAAGEEPWPSDHLALLAEIELPVTQAAGGTQQLAQESEGQRQHRAPSLEPAPHVAYQPHRAGGRGSQPCRFGAACTRADCVFAHPE